MFLIMDAAFTADETTPGRKKEEAKRNNRF